mmetsp:Transcript_74577/g.193903  ORF Transcript_74577/g.193903 Transcript_74577/m.193903 type:complete len:212 (+) Transcript_74577:545-1180(+)
MEPFATKLRDSSPCAANGGSTVQPPPASSSPWGSFATARGHGPGVMCEGSPVWTRARFTTRSQVDSTSTMITAQVSVTLPTTGPTRTITSGLANRPSRKTQNAFGMSSYENKTSSWAEPRSCIRATARMPSLLPWGESTSGAATPMAQATSSTMACNKGLAPFSFSASNSAWLTGEVFFFPPPPPTPPTPPSTRPSKAPAPRRRALPTRSC